MSFSICSWAQPKCNFSIHGKIADGETGNALPSATIFIDSLSKATSSNVNGLFELGHLCQGNHKVFYKLIGYKPLVVTYELHQSLEISALLFPDTSQLESITIIGEATKDAVFKTLPTAILAGHSLDQTRGLSLGESLKLIPGVNSLQTGPTISKPMIHGLHSNRVLIMNNGVRQESQQWGSEHAPEIDPFVATKLTVIKGPASIRYGSDAIGGVILVDPNDMPEQKSLTGEVNLVGMTNGQLGAVSGIVQGGFGKKLTGLSMRIQGTIRQAGNAKTSTYYMENTGMQENNFSGTLAYQKPWFGGEIYYSHFNTKLGIFSGSQVATVSDMEMAIQQSKPITPSYFSYTIGRPYQTVTHDLFKASGYLKLKQYGKLNLTFASQQNIRSEYDYIGFSGSLNPALYLSISTQTVDAIWSHAWFKNVTGSLGVNYMTQGNVRLYEFLIPNFRNYCGGIFLQEKWEKGRWTIEGGIRGDYRWLRVYTLDLNTAQVITPTYNFHNATGSIGATYRLNQSVSLLANLGTAWKAPTVNELFSNGVHQSAAAYEIGNPNLVSEQSYNLNASIKYNKKRFVGEIELYNHYINHYTYLKPDLQFIQTIRGSYPTFTYTQVDAVFRGIDITLQYKLLRGLTFISKTALIFSYNYTINNYLILTPANRFENSLKYEVDKFGKLANLYISITNLGVPTQTRVPPNSDYLPPPAGYDLWGADIGLDIPAGRQMVSINFGVTNLTNVAYRDYLNRFRYFTNNLGRNMVLRIKIPFELLKPK